MGRPTLVEKIVEEVGGKVDDPDASFLEVVKVDFDGDIPTEYYHNLHRLEDKYKIEQLERKIFKCSELGKKALATLVEHYGGSVRLLRPRIKPEDLNSDSEPRWETLRLSSNLRSKKERSLPQESTTLERNIASELITGLVIISITLRTLDFLLSLLGFQGFPLLGWLKIREIPDLLIGKVHTSLMLLLTASAFFTGMERYRHYVGRYFPMVQVWELSILVTTLVSASMMIISIEYPLIWFFSFSSLYMFAGIVYRMATSRMEKEKKALFGVKEIKRRWKHHFWVSLVLFLISGGLMVGKTFLTKVSYGYLLTAILIGLSFVLIFRWVHFKPKRRESLFKK